MHNPLQPQPVRQATTGDAASTQVGVHRGAGGHQAGAARKRPPWYRRPQSRRRAQASAVVPADTKQAPRAGVRCGAGGHQAGAARRGMQTHLTNELAYYLLDSR